MHKILLSSTLHDPLGRLLDDLPRALAVVLKYYEGWAVSYTPITNRKVKSLLLAHPHIYTKPETAGEPLAHEEIEFNHLRALEIAREMARAKNIPWVQYTDADRIIMAAHRFPESFEVLQKKLKKYKAQTKLYINIRRTIRDFLAHGMPLVHTEKVFNKFYSEVFGMSVDIGSTAHIMSTDVIDHILLGSPRMEPVSFPHPKWLIIAKSEKAQIKSEEIDGMLTFENPEQYKLEVIEEFEERKLSKRREKEIEITIPAHPQTHQKQEVIKLHEEGLSDVGREDLEDDYFLLQQAYESTIGKFSNASQREWRLRYHTQYQYLSVLRHNLSCLNLDAKKQKEFDRKITNAIEQMKEEKEALMHILRRHAEEVEITLKEKLQES